MKSKIFIIVGFLIVALVGWLVYFFTARSYQHQMEVASLQSKKQIDSLHSNLQKILEITDTTGIVNTFQQIDSSLARINKSLAMRGVALVKTRTISTKDRMQQSNLYEFAKYYAAITRDLEMNLLYTPFGLPSNGLKSSGFGFRHDPFFPDSLVLHNGLDFAGNIGDSVNVTADGVVRFAGTNGGYGNCIIITHSNGFETLYGHLSKIFVRPQQKVVSGEYIGLMGSSGRSTGPHLHYEVMRNSVKINPERFIKL